jgi:hypothetical protein
MKTIPQLHPFTRASTRFRWLIFTGLSLVILLSAAACKLQGSAGSSKEQETVMQFLGYIPDKPEYRQWTSYGDSAAWYASWNVPRVYSLDEVNALDDTSWAYWMGMMLSQTYPPDCLDLNYILGPSYSLRDEFGFDMFDMDRFIFAGSPPKVLSVMEFSIDRKRIEDALAEKGYTAKDYGDGWVLYSLGEDYKINSQAKTNAERLGNLNRILLSDHFMIVGKATEVVEAGLEAHDKKAPTLAGNKTYSASVQALYDSSLKDVGELVGVMWIGGSEFTSLPASFESFTQEQVQQMREDYGLNTDLPEFTLAAFATRHSQEKGATYLILALVFPKGTDTEEAARVLEERLENGYSLRNRVPFLEAMRTTDVNTYAVQAGGLPVTLTVFRLDDPELTTSGGFERPMGRVRAWMEFVVSRDLLFLYTGP